MLEANHSPWQIVGNLLLTLTIYCQVVSFYALLALSSLLEAPQCVPLAPFHLFFPGLPTVHIFKNMYKIVGCGGGCKGVGEGKVSMKTLGKVYFFFTRAVAH